MGEVMSGSGAGSQRATVIPPTMATAREERSDRPVGVSRSGSNQARSGGSVGVTVAEAEDLRRTHRREVVDRLLECCPHLPEQERVLIVSVFGAGQSATDLAGLLREDPRVTRRRVRRIIRRAMSPMFSYVARRSEAWPATRRAVARACYLQGLSMREAAARTGATLHAVRRHCLAVRAMLEVESSLRRAG